MKTRKHSHCGPNYCQHISADGGGAGGGGVGEAHTIAGVPQYNNILKWLSENFHFQATFPTLDWAQTCARLQRCDQCINGFNNQVRQYRTGHSHNSYSIKSCMRQFGAHSLGLELCVTLSVCCAATFSSHTSKSSVNHLNHWCATLRDRTSCWQFHIWITMGRKPVFFWQSLWGCVAIWRGIA